MKMIVECSGRRLGSFGWMPGLVIVGMVTATVAGCAAQAPPQVTEDEIHPQEDIALNTEEVRLRMRALVEPLSGAIVESADRIGADSHNPEVRREALLWKIEAIPALRESLFRPNPFAAIMDSWVLAWQMRDYFETGRGRKALGDAAPVAVATCDFLENEIRMVAASFTVSGNVSVAAEFARQWAQDHAIRFSIASRESTLSRVGEREVADALSIKELAGSVGITLDDLTRRLDVYSAQLLEQSRWQAELFAMDLAAEYQLEAAMPLAESAVATASETMEAVQELLPEVEDALVVAESTPEIIGRERQAAIDALVAQTTRVMQFAQQERIATLEFLTGEREVILGEMQQTIATERERMMADVERISTDVLDHVIIRVAQLAGIGLLAAFVGVVVLLLITRRVFAPRLPA